MTHHFWAHNTKITHHFWAHNTKITHHFWAHNTKITHHFYSLKCVYQENNDVMCDMHIAFLSVSTFHGVSSVDIKNNIRDPLFYLRDPMASTII